MKSTNTVLCYLLFAPFATSALRGQQYQQQQQPLGADSFKTINQEQRWLSSDNYEITFIEADDTIDSRSPPTDAYINQDTHDKLMNRQDVVYQGVAFQPDGTQLLSSATSQGKRVKGAELMAEGVSFVTILPEEMNDCDPELMDKMGFDTSTCETVLDTSMEGGGVAFEMIDEDYEEEGEEEEDYIRELMESTEGEEYTANYFRDDGMRRRLNYDTGLTYDIGIFEPLQCNMNEQNVSILPTGEDCDANPDHLMSNLVADAGDDAVVIPCGQCVKYDLPANSTSFINGLDIQGKLYVPPNYKSTLHTPYVFVQGELQMSDTNVISPENESMKIVLVGTENVTFTPADSNWNVSGTPFNAGFKPFLVAGGKLDVRGWDISPAQERVATWTSVLSSIEGSQPEPILPPHFLVPVPIQPNTTDRACPRVIAEHNFTESIDYSLWSGGDSAILSHDAAEGIMVVSNINRDWQGPRIDLTKLTLDCPLQENVDYLLTVRIKIDKEGESGQDMPCHNTENSWNDCPRWMRKIMFKDGNDRYSHQRLNTGTLGKYGEWFTFATVWRYSAEDVGQNVTGNIFAIENIGSGTTISMDEFIFELPSSKSFPKINETCSELVVHGDAEDTDGRGYAFYPMWSSRSSSWEPTITQETKSNGAINKFYRAENRRWHSDSIRFNMPIGCFEKAMSYWISLKVRVSSEEPLSYYIRLEGQRYSDSGTERKNVLFCPPQTKLDGWVTCSGPYIVEDDFNLSKIKSDIEFRVYMDHEVDNGGTDETWATVDYDDISVSFMAGPAEGLNVKEGVVSKWGAKSEVHITSSTIDNKDSQNGVIKSVTTDNGLAKIMLETGIDTVLTEEDTAGMGVEVALLSRNIKIEGEGGGTALEGGYFQVLHTPGVAQIIEGVEFTNMGQQQGKNRFALQFLYSGDVPGTSIARNAIRNSNHRCIVLEGSSNITVEANVAHDTAGHCYYVGSEATDNQLAYNIGSRTNGDIYWGNHIPWESDYSRATFQLYNPSNDYIGNVAAGSEGRGFGVYNSWRTLGEDYFDTEKGNIRRLEMKTFRDNKAHSNMWQGFSFADFEQFFDLRDFDRVPVFKNTQSYRNREHGIYSHNAVAARFIGGIVADNQWGFVVQDSDHVEIDGMVIKGLTDTLKFITTPVNREKICSRSNWSHEGIRIMTKKSGYGETDPNRGIRLRNVAFSDFDENTGSCYLGSWPIAWSDRGINDGHFDYTSSLKNVTISDSRGLFMNGCKALSSYGVDDIVISDKDGYLVASLNGASQEEASGGVWVTNSDHMKFDGCIEYPDNCMAFCPDICLRTVKYSVEQYGTEDLKLLVTDGNGNSRSISGKIKQEDYFRFSRAFNFRTFSASLPEGEYTAQFIDQNGNRVWPIYVEESWESTPDCPMSAGPLDIKLLDLRISDSSYCDEMIRNGGQDDVLTTSEPWVHTDPGVEVGHNLGRNLSDAIVTIDRTSSYSGIGQSLDSRCVQKMRNRYVEFSAWIMLNDNGTLAENINPDSSWWYRESPQLAVHYRKHRDTSTKEYIYREEINDVALLARPYKSEDWNLIHGIFRLPSTFHLFLEIDSAPEDLDFYLDDVSMKPNYCNPNQIVRNGNLEELDITKWWDTWGEAKLDITSGYRGSTNAVRASEREHYSWGPAQVVNLDCNFDVGDRLLFQARLRFEVDGEVSPCNIYTWNSGERCSDIYLYTRKNGARQYYRVGQIMTNDPEDGWYHAHGVLVLNEDQVDPEYAKVYFDGIHTSKDVVVDNVEVKIAPQDCSELILNPTVVDSSYWGYIDRGYSQLDLVPGASGGSDLALRSFGRSSSTRRGIRQQLDARCFISDVEYEISAKFRLLNSTTSEGVMCDTNVQENNRDKTQCPSVTIVGWNCDKHPITNSTDVYWRFWNDIPYFEWDPENFNEFNVGFVVDDRLSSCDSVHLYINEVNNDWDIVIDDVHITAGNTQAPSFLSTAAPTDNAPNPTNVPTTHPTSLPTVVSATDCPLVGAPSKIIPAGPIMLAKSNSLCILTKAVEDVDGSLSYVSPVARSYEGRAWEPSAGEFATQLLYEVEFADYSSGTQINLPQLSVGEQYYLTSYTYSVSHVEALARLFETATFGTRAQDLDAWDKGDVTTVTVSEWIQEQISKPMTSHREFFRRRVNPRFPNPKSIGRSDHPCNKLSRWRKYAFSKKDGDLWWFRQYLSTTYRDGDEYVTVKLNGHTRTMVPPGSIVFQDTDNIFEYNRIYELCRLPDERAYGRVYLKVEDGCRWFENPFINFYPDIVLPPNILNLPNISESIFEPIDEIRSEAGEFILFDGLNQPLCDLLNDVTEQNDAPVFGRLPDGSWLQYEPRLILEENTAEAHIDDGGGLVEILTGQRTKCANVPRTFLNEENCTLSTTSSTCGASTTTIINIELNETNIADLHVITGQYVYGVLGLPVVDFQNTSLPSPCTPGLRSRWEVKNATDCPSPTLLEADTNSTLHYLLAHSRDSNPFVKDITFPSSGYMCGESDTESLGHVDIVVESTCFKRVHPEHLSVYDFTYWTLENTHPGNMVAMMDNEPNPIKKWMDNYHSIFLKYPSFHDSHDEQGDNHHDVPNHPIERWNTHSVHFSKLGRYGDTIRFVDLPNEVRTEEVKAYFGDEDATGGFGTIVCGSPNEVDNDPTLGYQFDVVTGEDTEWGLDHQREHIWTMIALESEDQLRQRVAWALSQLLVVVPSAVEIAGSHTEAFLGYYDIFVRNAFGNYRDILREISFSPLMAENLSFLQSKSAAYQWETQQKVSFADENFAREIMQLFSTGLYLLNIDGTPKLDDNKQPILVYTNDEIMSFARIWTGFDYQQLRGNVEEASRSGNRHDPMRIQASWRDKFPKSDLLGGYIGDGYPLCVDLPQKMFLRKGAVYRLLGASFMPELMEDDPAFETDPDIRRFTLDASSKLRAKLCNQDSNGSCQYANSVTLDSNLDCTDKECNADTVRVVEVSGIFYEYIRPPCVEQAFYANARKVINKERFYDSSCANPLLPYASEACCETGDLRAYRSPDYLYDQERVLWSTADSRCEAMGLKSCDFNEIRGLAWHKQGYHWSTDGCLIRVKVNAIGQVALVYEPDDYAYLHPHIDVANRNFFKVYWDGKYPLNNNDVPEGNSCGNGVCQSLSTGGCLCDTSISISRVFKSMPGSVDEVLTKLTIGAFDPEAYDSGTFVNVLTENGVTAHMTVAGVFTKDTVFVVTDSHGRIRRFKNSKEYVRIQGAPEFAFRNAPSFMSVLNTEAVVRDALYETEAALDHYMYHDNTAPFIAYRMIQRFTTSNPNPNYIKAVATAFRNGKYGDFGTGKYGDMEATIAAVFLEPEARSTVLYADPFIGGVNEPLLRVVSLMRSMELQQVEGQPISRLDDMPNKIGMMAHSFPTVFSFYLPEYSPDNRPGQATLVSPEAQIMDMPKTVGLLNGMFSLIKYGLSNCNGGFGGNWKSCVEGNYVGAQSYLSFTRPYHKGTGISKEDHAKAVIDELSTLLTSGRLSSRSREVIRAAYLTKLSDPLGGDGAALRLAQQLLVTTPEFQTSNTIQFNGQIRSHPEPPQSKGSVYKAIVYVMFAGGADSYNMLLPHTCPADQDLYAEYKLVREEIALEKGHLRVLEGTTENQICDKFGVHPKLEAVQAMYNDGDLLFFTNTGVLTKETDKQNYSRDTVTQLFAHNWMQREAQRVDPLKQEDGTGILGRIADELTKKGLNVGSFSIDTNAISLIGEPGTSPAPFILSRGGVTNFNSAPSSEAMNSLITSLNEATSTDSGAFGELWSSKLLKSISDNKLLYDTLSDKVTVTTFPESHLGRQLEMVAKMIDSRAERGSDADVFFLETGGWDTHSDVEDNLNNLFENVDASFHAFAEEMKAKETWESVTVIQTSDFARTLNPNTGRGSDHAWGGNYMMFGGDVKGRQIVGKYPGNLTDDGALSLGRGRMIPTTSWDAVFVPLAEWAGVDKANLDYVCPNRGNFPTSHFTSVSDLFEFSTPSPTISNPPSTSNKPSVNPTTSRPSSAPTSKSPVSKAPSTSPTASPFKSPTSAPSATPSSAPTSKAPISKAPSTNPTASPFTSPTSAPSTNPVTTGSSCPIKARKVKIVHGSGGIIGVFEVQVFATSGDEVAQNKVASQSSTLKDFDAILAVDGSLNTFSHTDGSSSNLAWWEVDLGERQDIQSVRIFNRWCRDSSDPTGCLCRLSGSTLELFDDQGVVVSSQFIGDTCGELVLSFDFSCSPSSPTSLSPTVSPSASSCDQPKALKVKIDHLPGATLNIREVQVFAPSGQELAQNKVASQSSTLKWFSANLAVDGDLSNFAHSDASSGDPVWWEVDLGEEQDIQSVKVMNRYCRDESDPNGCLCRLSEATIKLVDSAGVVTALQPVGDACGQLALDFDFTCITSA